MKNDISHNVIKPKICFSPMILVTTPTGNIGKKVLEELLQAGSSVRVLARYPEKIEASASTKVEIVQGSLDDVKAVATALSGVESVFFCVPQSNQWEDAFKYYGGFANILCEALQNTANVRVVSISSGGYGVKNAGPVSALHAMEDTINVTGVATRHLRCGYFMENLLYSAPVIVKSGSIIQPFGGNVPLPMVATQDIAAMAVKLLLDKSWLDQNFQPVHGFEDLSMEQAAAILREVLQRPIKYLCVEPEMVRQYLLSLGSSAGFASAYLDMCAAFAGGAYEREPRTSSSTTPTTLQEWAMSALLPAVKNLDSSHKPR